MRRWLVLLATTGCFSERNAPPSECTRGEPGCDCASDGTCADGSECVASIDKCVPEDCTPGSRTCTCAAGMECLGMLTCQGGVCLDPAPDTTADPTNASGAQTSEASVTGPMTSSPGTDTVTDTSMPTSATAGTDSSVDTGEEMTSASTTAPSDVGTVDCLQCLVEASADPMCTDAYGNCSDDSALGGCKGLYTCVVDQEAGLQECCETYNGTMTGHLLWSAFTSCAQDTACMGACYFTCPV